MKRASDEKILPNGRKYLTRQSSNFCVGNMWHRTSMWFEKVVKCDIAEESLKISVCLAREAGRFSLPIG